MVKFEDRMIFNSVFFSGAWLHVTQNNFGIPKSCGEIFFQIQIQIHIPFRQGMTTIFSPSWFRWQHGEVEEEA
jgi:hypothetical protein